jgi:hypothetical protein
MYTIVEHPDGDMCVTKIDLVEDVEQYSEFVPSNVNFKIYIIFITIGFSLSAAYVCYLKYFS